MGVSTDALKSSISGVTLWHEVRRLRLGNSVTLNDIVRPVVASGGSDF